MFDLPSETGVVEVVVTAASVAGTEQPRRVYADLPTAAADGAASAAPVSSVL